jgi:chemotaxis protein MotB
MAEPALKLASDDNNNPGDLKETSVFFDDGETLPEAAEASDEGEGNWLVSYADMMTLLVGFFVVLQSFSKIDAQAFEQVKKETTKLFGGEYQVPFEDVTKDLRKVVEDLKVADQVLFSQTDDGVEITFRGALFFDPGAFELRPEALKLLSELIPVISNKAKDFGIVVEGHTDNTPLTAKGALSTNWELSSVRACRVLRLFEERGFQSNRMKALGWGATRPLVQEDGASGAQLAELQSQNRRVVIKILKDFES